MLPVGLLTGCANMVNTAPESNAFSVPGTMTGVIHGGSQTISGATIKLYAVGTTGYGTGATLLATTTSGTSGSYSFSQVTSGATGPTGNTYTCPSSSSLVYLIGSGGNTQGTGSTKNPASVMLTAVGACGANGSTKVDSNEAITAASVFALAQYINPGTTTPGTAVIGSPNTTQAELGLTNAFATVNNLINISSGYPKASFTTTGGATGITVTATPEQSKLNTIANILAACVDTPDGSTSGACGTLFNAAVPPVAARTSQPSATFNTAVDTLQAAYYMATNPTNSATTALTNLNSLYTLSTATTPFQPALSAAPVDWTLGITYSASGTCTNANNASFLGSAESLAVDASGNVWFNNGATAGVNAIGELTPGGVPAVCAFGTIPSGRGLTIDTAGNVWTTGGSTTVTPTASTYEYLAGGTTLNWPTATAANGIVADGSGNVFYLPAGSGTPIQEYAGAASATATSAAVSVGGNLTSSTGLLYVAADTTGRLWAPTTSSAGTYELYPDTTSGTQTNGYSSVDVGTTSVGSAVLSNPYGSAIDSSGNIFGGNTCCANAVSNTLFKITPGSTAGTASGTNSAKFAGGVVAPRSTAVDGAGNVWAGMGYPVVTAVTGPPATSAVYALAEVDNSFNSISYGGPNGATGPATCSSTGSNCPTGGGFQKASLGTVRSLAIDPSGNVWAASNVSSSVSYVVEVVGAAVPVVTPISAAIKAGKLGAKP